jgi:hypothetical protein
VVIVSVVEIVRVDPGRVAVDKIVEVMVLAGSVVVRVSVVPELETVVVMTSPGRVVVKYCVLTVVDPGNWTVVPGNCTVVPGSCTVVPGSCTVVPGSSTVVGVAIVTVIGISTREVSVIVIVDVTGVPLIVLVIVSVLVR